MGCLLSKPNSVKNTKHCCKKCKIVYNTDTQKHCCKCKTVYSSQYDIYFPHCCKKCKKCKTVYNINTQKHCCECKIVYNTDTQKHCCKCKTVYSSKYDILFKTHCCACKTVYSINKENHCCECKIAYSIKKNHCCKCKIAYSINEKHCCKCKIAYFINTENHCCKCNIKYDKIKCTREHNRDYLSSYRSDCHSCDIRCNTNHCCKCKMVYNNSEKHCCECKIVYKNCLQHCCECKMVYNNFHEKHCCECKIKFSSYRIETPCCIECKMEWSFTQPNIKLIEIIGNKILYNEWLDTNDGLHWLYTDDGITWLNCINGWNYISNKQHLINLDLFNIAISKSEYKILLEKNKINWFKSDFGVCFLQSENGKIFIEWMKTWVNQPEYLKWLFTSDGNAWTINNMNEYILSVVIASSQLEVKIANGIVLNTD
jgi:hypothetical protein